MSITSAAISSAALAQSNVAINIAMDAECKNLLNTFDSANTPTIAEQREYAGSVYRIHGDGEPMAFETIIIIKAVILIMFISAIYGAWKEYNESYFDVFQMSLAGIAYAFVAFAAMIFIASAGYGILFLFK